MELARMMSYRNFITYLIHYGFEEVEVEEVRKEKPIPQFLGSSDPDSMAKAIWFGRLSLDENGKFVRREKD